jgi:hypothetical protein
VPDIIVTGGSSVQAVITPAQPVQAVVTPATPVSISVNGTLRGDQGIPGPTGPRGFTGGIVPITVSTTPPVSPNVNDLWIDIS